MIFVFEITVNDAGTRPSLTLVAPLKLFPLIVTRIPRLPDVGVKLEIDGLPVTAVTVKFDALVPVPLGVVTEILPVVAPVGTRAVRLVSELKVMLVDAVPLNFTLVTPVKPAPVTETFVPTGPLVGVNEATVGGLPPPPPVTVKLDALAPVPFGVETPTGPVWAPVGTVAWSSVAESTLNVVAATPPNVTPVAPVKLVPMTSTFVPTGPLVGVNEVTTGGLPPPRRAARELERADARVPVEGAVAGQVLAACTRTCSRRSGRCSCSL